MKPHYVIEADESDRDLYSSHHPKCKSVAAELPYVKYSVSIYHVIFFVGYDDTIYWPYPDGSIHETIRPIMISNDPIIAKVRTWIKQRKLPRNYKRTVMKYLLCLLFLSGCTVESTMRNTYITDGDLKMACSRADINTHGVMGIDCVDLTCVNNKPFDIVLRTGIVFRGTVMERRCPQAIPPDYL